MEDVDVIEGVPVAMIYPCAEWGASGGSSRTSKYIIPPSGYRRTELVISAVRLLSLTQILTLLIFLSVDVNDFCTSTLLYLQTKI